jgi:hypothetical protein
MGGEADCGRLPSFPTPSIGSIDLRIPEKLIVAPVAGKPAKGHLPNRNIICRQRLGGLLKYYQRAA